MPITDLTKMQVAERAKVVQSHIETLAETPQDPLVRRLIEAGMSYSHLSETDQENDSLSQARAALMGEYVRQLQQACSDFQRASQDIRRIAMFMQFEAEPEADEDDNLEQSD